jgi:GNAT superfamily N-acetyltransferase
VTPPRVAVRTAVAADGARLAELLDGGALTAKEDTGHAGPYLDALADIAATPGNTVLVAEVDGRVVGMCQLIIFRHLQERGGWCAEVESVHVDARERSNGIGSVLMAAAIEAAEAAGCYRVQLTSHAARTDAQRFYRRLGFTPSHIGYKLLLGRGRADRGSPG